MMHWLCRHGMHDWEDCKRTDHNEEDLVKTNYKEFWNALFWGWHGYNIYRTCKRCGLKQWFLNGQWIDGKRSK